MAPKKSKTVKKQAPTKQVKPLDNKKKSPILLILAIFVLLAIILPCGLLTFLYVRGLTFGSGKVISQNRAVTNFNSIKFNGAGNIYLTQSDYESLKIEAEDNIISKIESGISGKTLEIGYKSSFPYVFGPQIIPTRPINIYITTKNINRIEINGAAEIKTNKIRTDKLVLLINGATNSEFNISAYRLDVTINGAGKVAIEGDVVSNYLIVNGAGKYIAENLKATNTSINIQGNGDATVNTRKSLDVKISGSGTVSYLGSPEVSKTISGTGKVVQVRK